MAWDSSEAKEGGRQRVERELELRRDGGEVFEPLPALQSVKKIAQTFWGAAWCRHLTEYSAYAHGLPRGRRLLRQGNVHHLRVEEGSIAALVGGADLYEVHVRVDPLDGEDWKRLGEACAGRIPSLLDLLGGQLGEGVLRVVCDPENGLFPRSGDIRVRCTCPDWADLCEHSAAVLYGVGLKLDGEPSLLFRLRGVDPADLLRAGAADVLEGAALDESLLDGEDLGALFGIEWTGEAPREPDAGGDGLRGSG